MESAEQRLEKVNGQLHKRSITGALHRYTRPEGADEMLQIAHSSSYEKANKEQVLGNQGDVSMILSALDDDSCNPLYHEAQDVPEA